MKPIQKYLIMVSAAALTAASAVAEIKLPAFFSDGMVVQQEIGAPIWGQADAGTKVTVRFAGKAEQAVADAKGDWRVVLTGLKASAEGAELKIAAGGETRIIRDVLVGEVWLASGQSNMEWMMKQSSSRDYAKTVNRPAIRQYTAENVSAATPQQDYVGQWLPASPEHTAAFSAAGYHFAEKLNQELNIPIGIIEVAWGGKPIQSFISDPAIRALPAAANLVKSKADRMAAYTPEKAEQQYQQSLKKFEAEKQKWAEGGKKGRGPRPPKKQEDPASASGMHSNIYHGMIHPFVGYGARGVIWYQGEASQALQQDYRLFLQALVQDWRQLWGRELSFYWVQLAAFREPTTEPGIENKWVDVQDAQRRALKMISRSGMAVTNDIGSAGIHPSNKKDVGLRLARWALLQDYGKTEVIPSGPLFQSVQFQGGKAVVSFRWASGLTTSDGEKPGRFELAGPDGKWVWADAEIQGERVVVSAPSVTQAVQVRYAWAQNPEGANLVNAEGLPASCFSSETGE